MQGTALAVVVVLLCAGGVLAEGGPAVDWWVLTGGGAPASGTGVALNDTLGQPIIGPASGETVGLNAGYWAIASGASLAVTLANFTAEGQAGQVLVSWETVSEIDNAGFNLYRSDSAAGLQTLLGYTPSQAPGSTQGAAYSYVDAAVEAGQTYWYWLEDVDLAGATTLHGPVSATVLTPTAVTMAGFEAAAGSTKPVAWLVLAAGLAAAAGGLIWRRRQEAVR
jgi:hypothetical protein